MQPDEEHVYVLHIEGREVVCALRSPVPVRDDAIFFHE
jgi:hypothetical protein